MAGEIKAEFTGNLGSIAEVKTSAAGKQYVTFNVGVTPSKKVGNEYVNGETTWIRVTSFDTDVTVTDQLMKGVRVIVAGRLTIRTADNGKVFHDVVADSITVVQREKPAVKQWDEPARSAKPRNSNDWGAPVVDPAYAFADNDAPF